jgi:protease inhibitor Inh
MTMHVLSTSALAFAGLALASCGGGTSLSGSVNAPQAAPPPAVSMAGRWLLSSPGRGQCHMTFGGDATGGLEGTIRPEGGCPGKLFTSRKWTFEQGSLVMRDHNGQPLAQLSDNGGNFDGRATSGEPVALTR